MRSLRGFHPEVGEKRLGIILKSPTYSKLFLVAPRGGWLLPICFLIDKSCHCMAAWFVLYY